jgi:hypothetical protein
VDKRKRATTHNSLVWLDVHATAAGASETGVIKGRGLMARVDVPPVFLVADGAQKTTSCRFLGKRKIEREEEIELSFLLTVLSLDRSMDDTHTPKTGVGWLFFVRKFSFPLVGHFRLCPP